ncbi:MAG: 3-keto-disaccharide hydrolase [Luteolibacter sp.]
MKTALFGIAASLALFVSTSAEETILFNGKDLTGWKGVEGFWSVKDGAITGTTTADNPAKKNTFLVWQDGKPGDFVLTFKYRLLDAEGKGEGYANSGVQYRSKVLDESYWVVGGYQADMELGSKYSGILYEEKGRGILALRGEKVVLEDGENQKKPKKNVVGETTPSADVQAGIKQGDWNDYKIVAKGNVVEHWINGKLSVHLTDNTAVAPKEGVIALQLHQGKPMTAQFKDLVLVSQ